MICSKKLVPKIFVLLMLSTVGACLATESKLPNCELAWSEFIDNTNQAEMNKLLMILEGDRKCINELSAFPAIFNSLISQTKEGNQYSAQVLSHILNGLRGGNYEDAARAIGSLLDSDVQAFFDAIENISPENHDFEAVVTMLPLSTVDDIKKRIEILDLRLLNLNKKLANSNIKKSEKAIQLITEYKSELEPFL